MVAHASKFENHNERNDPPGGTRQNSKGRREITERPSRKVRIRGRIREESSDEGNKAETDASVQG